MTDPEGGRVLDGGTFDFGEVGLEQSREVVFSAHNGGPGLITFQGLSVDGAGFLPGQTPIPTTIQADEDATFSILFDAGDLPQETHTGTATLSLEGSSDATFGFDLEATVVKGPELLFLDKGRESVDPSVPYVCCGANHNDEPVQFDFFLRNVGGGVLRIDNFELQNLDGEHAFRVVLAPERELTTEPTTIDLEMDTGQLGEFRALMRFDTNDPNLSRLELEIRGEVSQTGIELRDQHGQRIPMYHDQVFRKTDFGSPLEELFTIENLGVDAVEILDDSAISGSQFEFVSLAGDILWPRTLLPGSPYQFYIRFNATAPAVTKERVVLRYTEDGVPKTFEFFVTGETEAFGPRLCVVARPIPEVPLPLDLEPELDCNLFPGQTVEFGQQPLSDAVGLDVTLKNIGDQPLVVSNIRTNPEGIWYLNATIPGGGDYPFELPPGNPNAAISLEFTLIPPQIGQFPTFLEVYSNDLDHPLFRFDVEVEIVNDGNGDPDLMVWAGDQPLDNGDPFTIPPVPTGPPMEQYFRIQNTGTGFLALSDFEAGPTPVFRPAFAPWPSLGPGESTSFAIDVGWTEGIHQGYARFRTNVPGKEIFELDLTVLVSDTGGAGPRISVRPWNADHALANEGEFSFGATLIGTPVEQNFSIRNEGTEPLLLALANTGGEAFTIVRAPPERIDPSRSGLFTLRMEAAEAGNPEGSVRLDSNAVNANPFVFDLVGTVQAQPEHGPGLTVSLDGLPLARGSWYYLTPVETYDWTEVPITLHNPGNADLEISRFETFLGVDFYFNGEPLSLAPDESVTLPLRYNPGNASPTYSNAHIEMYTNLPELPYFDFWVQGTRQGNNLQGPILLVEEPLKEPPGVPSGSTHFFGTTGPACSIEKTFDLVNIGDSRLEVERLLVLGDAFQLTSSVPAQIAPNGRAPVRITQSSPVPKVHHGSASIHSNDILRASYAFTLTGEVLGTCEPGPTTLCLQNGRFRVELGYRDHHNGNVPGVGKVRPFSEETGFFWFFEESNIEVLVKIIDGRKVDGFYWIFYGGLTDLAYDLSVVDTVTGRRQHFQKSAGSLDGDRITDRFDESCNDLASLTASFEGVPKELPPPPSAPAAAMASTAGDCTAGPDNLCLLDDRFRVEVDWVNQHDGGNIGPGRSIPLTDATGLFWFFKPDNLEIAVKVLDGRGVNGYFWVFVGSLTDVEFLLRVTDSVTGAQWSYHNPPGAYRGQADVTAFAPVPAIQIVQDWDGAPIDAGGTVAFPETALGESVSRTIRIDNAGDSSLSIVNPGALVSGSGFHQLEAPAGEVPPNASSSFVVEFAPQAQGESLGSVTIVSNDPDESSFDFSLSGFADPPDEMDPPLVSIGRPGPGETVTGTAGFRGWAIDASSIESLSLELDGLPLAAPVYGTHRPDVCDVHAAVGDPNCPDVGWAAGFDSTLYPPGTHQLKLIARDRAGNTAERIRDFTIDNPPTGAISMLAPGGGETWALGTSQTIRWSSTGLSGNVTIELSRDGGAFQTLAASTENDGSFTWVPTGAKTLAAIVRVVSLFDARVFGIAEPVTLYDPGDVCQPGDTTLCLHDRRFRLSVGWFNPSDGTSGSGQVIPYSRDAGFFWFFHRDNLEVGVKLLDARSFDDAFWLFHGCTTSVYYSLQVTDTYTDRTKVYTKTSAALCGGEDTRAFPAPRAASSQAADALSLPKLSSPTCQPGPTSVCLLDGRFKAEVRLGGLPRPAMQVTRDTAAFWFYSEGNPEVIVKVVDARAIGSGFWISYGSLTDQSFTVTVTDTVTGAVRTYVANGAFCGTADTASFPP